MENEITPPLPPQPANQGAARIQLPQLRNQLKTKLHRLAKKLKRYRAEQRALITQKDLGYTNGHLIDQRLFRLSDRVTSLRDEMRVVREHGRTLAANLEAQAKAANGRELDQALERTAQLAQQTSLSLERADALASRVEQVEQRVQTLTELADTLNSLAVDNLAQNTLTTNLLAEPGGSFPRLTNVVAFRRNEARSQPDDWRTLVESQQQAIERLERRLNLTEDTTEDLEDKDRQLAATLDEIEARQQRLLEQAGDRAVDEADEAVVRRLRQLEEGSATLQVQGNQLAVQVADLAEFVARLPREERNAEAVLIQAESPIPPPQELDIGPLCDQVEAQGRGIREGETRLAALEQGAEELHRAMNQAVQELRSLTDRSHLLQARNKAMQLNIDERMEEVHRAIEDLFNQLQAVGKTQQELQGTTSGLQAGLGKAITDLDRTASQLGQLGSRVSAVAAQGTDLGGQLQQLQAAHAQTESRLERQQGKFDRLEAEFNQARAQTEKHEVRLEQLDRRQEMGHATQQRLRDDVSGLRQRLADTAKGLDDVYRGTTAHQGALWSVVMVLLVLGGGWYWSQSLEQRGQDQLLQQDREAWRQAIAQQGADIGELKSRVAAETTLRDDIVKLTNRINEQKSLPVEPSPQVQTGTEIAGIRQELTALRGDITLLRTTQTELGDRLARPSGETSSSQPQTGVETAGTLQALTGMRDEFGQMRGEQNQLGERIERLTADLTALRQARAEPTGIQQTLAGFQGDVGQVRADQGRLEERIERLTADLTALRQTQADMAGRLNTRSLPSTPSSLGMAAIQGEDWLLTQDPGSYSLQIFGAFTQGPVLKLAAAHNWNRELAIYTGVREGRSWNMLLYGVFPSMAEAQAAISELPSEVRVGGPWARSLARVQERIRRR